MLSFFIYAEDYYHATDEALRALESDAVAVSRTDYGWFFDGPGDDSALIFYPGAKVDETAYAPMLHALASSGIDVCLVRMPLRFAVLDASAADRILERYDYEHVYIGGHSLGGAVAANYASAHELDGVILFAAYPTKDVDERMLIICGTEDGVVNRARLAEADSFGEVEEVEIKGGNHSGFGNYGEQSGDSAPTISSEEQQRLAVEAIGVWLEELRQG